MFVFKTLLYFKKKIKMFKYYNNTIVIEHIIVNKNL